ncbi:MAG: TolC family protein [Deltaproteobacteria bacterium]|nr:TolC family protein [Deltaproteobacteria bacterium]
MRSRPFLALLPYLLALPVHAAEDARPAEGRSLTFGAALDLVRAQGVDVLGARLDAARVEASSRAAHRAWQPDLSLGASSTERLDKDGTSASFDAGLQSSVALWHGGEVRGRSRGAAADATAARHSLDRAYQDVAWDLATRWIALDQARARLAVAGTSSDLEATTLERIQALVDAGARTRADLASQRASVAEAIATVAQAEGNVALSELSLVHLLRLDATQDWAFEPLEDRPPIRTEASRSLLDEAIRERPDLAALCADADSADAAVAVARAGWLPSLDLGAGLSTGWSSASEGTLAGQLDRSVGGSLALQLQVPLWDRGATRSAVDQARSSRELAGLVLEDARQEAMTEVLSVLERQRTAAAVLTATQSRVQAAEEAEALTRLRYEAGAASLVELAQARSTLEDARQSEVTARYDVLSLQWELAWATGSLAVP